AIVKGESHGSRYSWCCCGLCGICGICSPKVMMFFLLAILVTCIGGAVLWNSGILQPLLAQLLLYAYII
ncbi:ppk34, partial [Symbiodinium sp. CCMP2456]